MKRFDIGLQKKSEMTKIICWNINHNHTAWRSLVGADADIALLQEAIEPEEHVKRRIEVDPEPFRNAKGRKIRRCAIVKASDRVNVEYLTPVPLSETRDGDFKSTHPGCIAAAIITPANGISFTAVSFCPEFEKPHWSTGKISWNIIDASVHRVISDLSLLIGKQSGHRIIAAGDLTITYRYGKNEYWTRRESTVFDRMRALGLPFVGPQHPDGRQADPWPDELPKNSKNVPTYIHSSQTPKTATRQLDYVFASESLIDSVKVRALNSPEEWGPSDHCRIEIEVE